MAQLWECRHRAVLTGSCWVWPTGLEIFLLGMALGNENLEMWTLTQDKECDLTGYLRVKLQYKNRLQYMVTRRAPHGSLVPSPKAHLELRSLPSPMCQPQGYGSILHLCLPRNQCLQVHHLPPFTDPQAYFLWLSSYNLDKVSRDLLGES